MISQKRNSKFSLWRLLVGILVTVALLAGLLHFVRWHDLATFAKQARWSYLALAVASYVALYAVRAWRFMLLAPETRFSLMFAITAVHNFMLRLLPARTGELSYAFLVKRAGTGGFGESLLGLTVLRLLDATTVLVFFGVTLGLNTTIYRGDAHRGLWAAGLSAFFGAALVLSFPVLLRVAAILLRWLSKTAFIAHNQRLSAILSQLIELAASHAHLSRTALVAAASLTLVHWLVHFVNVYVIMHAFAVNVTFAQAVLGGTAATVTGFLPIAGVGSFGALEAGWALGFVLVGLPRTQAVASGLAFSAVTFVNAAVFALGAWLGISRMAQKR